MIRAPRTFGQLVLLFVCASPTIARGQAILVEAYRESAEAAIGESDIKKAARLYALALAEARGQRNQELTAHVLLGAADVHIRMGQFSEAKANVKAALAIYEQLPDADPKAALAGLNAMAMIHYYQKRYEDAEAMYAKLIAAYQAEEANDNGALLGVALNDVARVQIALNHPEKAEKLAVAAADIMEARFGPGCASVALCLDTIAEAWRASGKHESAEKMATKALEISQAELGPEHAQIGSHLQTLGKIQQSRGNHQESLKSLERSLAIQQRGLGDNHPLVTEARETWARLRAQLSQSEPAEKQAKADASPGDRGEGPASPDKAPEKGERAASAK
jgi:tetratricopeptide (TPR) repeat protein